MKVIRKILVEWKQIAKYIGDFQSRLILTVFYFTVFMPFALITKLRRLFVLRSCVNGSAWENRQKDDATITAASMQF